MVWENWQVGRELGESKMDGENESVHILVLVEWHWPSCLLSVLFRLLLVILFHMFLCAMILLLFCKTTSLTSAPFTASHSDTDVPPHHDVIIVL